MIIVFKTNTGAEALRSKACDFQRALVSGGDLCEAKALTELTGETQSLWSGVRGVQVSSGDLFEAKALTELTSET